jgi:hypothetical protein
MLNTLTGSIGKTASDSALLQSFQYGLVRLIEMTK